MAAGDLIWTNYQREFNGWLFGSGTDFRIIKAEGELGKPDIKTTDFDRQDAWGSFPGRDMYKDRTITYTCDVLGYPDPDAHAPIEQNLDTMMSALAIPDILPVASQLQLVTLRPWPRGGKRFFYARPGRAQLTSNSDIPLGMAQVVFEMKCNDPRQYSLDEAADQVVLAANAGSTEIQCINNGSTASSPVITVEFEIGYMGFSIANQNYNNYGFVFQPPTPDTTDSPSVFTIDMRQRQFLWNGSDMSYAVPPTSNWWKLAPGNNLITFALVGGTLGSPVTVTVNHRDAWS